MQKGQVMIIGCGGCGGNQLNTLLNLDSRYTGIFMNTNLSEMEILSNFDRVRRCFYIPNADGTGKDRNIAETYIKEEAPKFAEMVKKFVNQDYLILIGSADGGTGSKALCMLPKIIKRFCPEKSINLIITFPNLDQGEISYKNSIDSWNEMLDLKNKNIIDSLLFIDNNSCDDESYINDLATEYIDNSFNLSEGKIDSSDLEKAQTSKGYKVILKLDENIKDVTKAIDKATKESCFYIPDNWESDIVLGSINTISHNLRDIKSKFQAFDINKFNTKAEGDSFILLGGCDIPLEPIQLMKECLKEIENKKRNRTEKINLEVKTTWNKKNNDKKSEDKSKSKLSSNDLKNMFADDSFWD